MVRLGEILLEANVINKRQLSRGLAMQETGDNRKLGEILVELGYITVDDLTDIMMTNGSPHEDRLPVVDKPKRARRSRKQEPVVKNETVFKNTEPLSFSNVCELYSVESWKYNVHDPLILYLLDEFLSIVYIYIIFF